MRGEHFIGMLNPMNNAGSSPHARGTPAKLAYQSIYEGIIPACAGNTYDEGYGDFETWDHPRMRGEHRSGFRSGFWCRGSSPHARGTRMQAGFILPHPGIIPACAGNTAISIFLKCASRDHPRMRGEHWRLELRLKSCWGSSPHARGTHENAHAETGLRGIIPACAGNTFSSRLQCFP